MLKQVVQILTILHESLGYQVRRTYCQAMFLPVSLNALNEIKRDKTRKL
jgi:hypothetical protein